MIQKRKRALARTWLLYHVLFLDRLQSGAYDSIEFIWDTFLIMLVASLWTIVTGRQWTGAMRYILRA